MLLIHCHRGPAFRLTSRLPSSESSQQGNSPAFLKNRPLYLTSQKPGTGQVQPWGAGEAQQRRGGGGAARWMSTPDSAIFYEAFNGILHFSKNENKALNFATFKQGRFGIISFSLFLFLFAHVFSGGKINNSDLPLGLSSQGSRREGKFLSQPIAVLAQPP